MAPGQVGQDVGPAKTSLRPHGPSVRITHDRDRPAHSGAAIEDHPAVLGATGRRPGHRHRPQRQYAVGDRADHRPGARQSGYLSRR
jgi:hypothetical protein